MSLTLPLVQVDAFTDRPFAGNPAAVVQLPRWLPDALLQAIALENNLSETAFLVKEAEGWRLRWFTPTVEVELCGHATLASGWVLLRPGGAEAGADEVRFATRSGTLVVRRAAGDALALALPRIAPVLAPPSPERDALIEALGAEPREVYRVRSVHAATYWMAVFERQATVAGLSPDLGRLGTALRSNAICTAPADDPALDFVSRFFAPASGVGEDPVTGSAHATLAPHWAARLGIPDDGSGRPLRARQISRRGGSLTCSFDPDGERVWLGGRCALFLEGRITLSEADLTG